MGYVTDSALFNRLLEQVKSFADISEASGASGLSIRSIDWIEFNVRGFWPYIVELAKRSSDDTIYFVDVEKAADDSFYRACGKFPAVSLSTGMTEEEYTTALYETPGGNLSQAFAPTFTDAYFMIPASGAWRVFGDSDTEQGKVISTVGLPPDELFPHDFLDAPNA
ncbi:hypothetical protein [Caballeronia sp. BCC1704]|uniref:hypothetical protein n=1 Tax=Caballeronia sp. BCC1704 TaxID=2676300 RepID=UPI00158C89B5|nr:hypothetical protein [Caballeronia sp. BCC1704]